MGRYQPLKVTGMATGLVQEREEFILPDDAYPVLQNAYVWRERILRKKGYQLLGRLQRQVTIAAPNNTNNLLQGLEPTATLVPGSLNVIGSAGFIWTDPLMNGVLQSNIGTFGTVNYATGVIVGPVSPNTGTFSYYPGLPVMGIRSREIQSISTDETIFFDQVYAYRWNSVTEHFEEFIPGTTWNAHGAGINGVDFFWSTNYWVSGNAFSPFGSSNLKLFWVTNNTGQFAGSADSPRITDGTTWVDFAPPTYGQIDAGPTYLTNWLVMLPFRGRMVTFNTWEGPDKANSLQYSNRIRWSTIGNPFIPFAAGPPSTGSWRDDIRGQGGFLDIPTSEDIIAIGFVRDNLVIYCEQSTWQLRYTGRSIAPFQVERVNSELGTESTFSAVQFDTSLVGFGDKGIVECDSYKSERIDIKIPDLVFHLQTRNNSTKRIHGVRDFINRLAFWTFTPESGVNQIFPTQRLLYNYENDSWATFNDSLTTLGIFQPTSSRTWLNTKKPWIELDFNWVNQPASVPAIVGGNQQGFIEYLDELTVNDVSLYIKGITANTTTPTSVNVPNHNMQSEFVIKISGIPTGTPFATLNNGVFGIEVVDADNFLLFTYNAGSGDFTTPQLDVPPGTFVGIGYISIRENFSIRSKKFNFLDEGQSIQIGYIDILMASTGREEPGAISLNMYLDYNDIEASNTIPKNDINDGSLLKDPDTFFNSIIPTSESTLNSIGGTKFWQRVYCSTNANFLTLEYTLSNAQLADNEQTKKVQIDAQVIWLRRGGRMGQL